MMANGFADHQLLDPGNRTVGEKGSVVARKQVPDYAARRYFSNEDEGIGASEEPSE